MRHTIFFEGQVDGTLRVDTTKKSKGIELNIQGGENVVFDIDDIKGLIDELQFILNDLEE